MSERNVWTSAHDDLLGALEQAVGRAHGERGHSAAAYRNAVRTLHNEGVTPQALSLLLYDYGRASVTASGPMVLSAFVRGGDASSGYLVCNRWPSTCAACGSEIPRGALCWYRRGPERGYVICADCEHVEHVSERADAARKRALERDDDPDSLLAALLERTPAGQRDAVEDSLPMSLFAEGP